MSRWPFPGDLPVDRARQVCVEYRRALLAIDADACKAIDQAAVYAGEAWVVNGLAVETEDDLVTVPRAAELVGRSTRWVYNWVAGDREHRDRGPRREGRIRVRLGDIQRAVAAERTRRGGL